MRKAHSSINKKLSNKRIKHVSSISQLHLLIVALVFVAIGGYVLYRSFAAPNPNLPGDLNNDNSVGITDLSILLSNYGGSSATADINGDGSVNITDLSILLSNYGRTVTSGDTTAPSVSLTAPASGATVSGSSVGFAATASDNVGVSKVEFYVDSSLVNSDTSSPYSYSWNSTSVANGTHTVLAKAYDAAGNNASKSVSVTVNNVVNPPPPPPPPIGGARPATVINANWVAGESTYFSSFSQDAAEVVSTHGYTTAVERFPGVRSWMVTSPPNGKARIYGRINGFSESGTDGHDRWYGFSFQLHGWKFTENTGGPGGFCAFTGTRYNDGQPNGPRGLTGCEGSSSGSTHIGSRTIIDPNTAVAGSALDYGAWLVNDRWIDQVFHIKWSGTNNGVVQVWTKYADQPWPSQPQTNWTGITDYWVSTGGPHFAWLGIYQGNSFSTTHNVYWGPYRIGASFAAVDPNNPAP
jgi:hypothetical protein